MRVVNSGLFVIIAFVASGCAPDAPTCTSDIVKNTVGSIVAGELSKQSDLSYVYDLKKSKYDLNAIRTVSATNRSCECKSSLHIIYEFSNTVKGTAGGDPNNDLSKILNKDKTIDIEYSAELTDDNKNTYVTVRGIR